MEAAQRALIDARGLGRRFGAFVAVEGLTLRVAPGEVLGLLGPNGAGKTTTLRMLAGLVAPTEGEGFVGGFRLGSASDDARRVLGILTEAPGLYPRLSARENLELFAELYGVADPTTAIDRWLRRLELHGRASDLAGTFSKGMQQKLSLARALLHDPIVLLLDEPTSALDPESAGAVREIIEEVAGRGGAVVVSTHNLDEAERLCGRVAVLSTRIVAMGTPAELRRGIGGTTVRVRVRTADGPALTDAAAVVRAIDGIERAEERAPDEILVTVRSGTSVEDVNPRLVRALVAGGADVVWVSEERRSLEEAYLSLVRERSPA